MKLSANSTSLRLSFFFIVVLAIIFPNIISREEDKLSLINLLGSIGIAGCLFLIPQIIENREKWFLNEAALIIYMLVLLTVLSNALGEHANLLVFPTIIISLFGLFMHMKNISYNSLNIFLFFTGLLITGFLISITYCVYHKWCYMDNIYSGNVHIDILFHSAICNSFDNSYVPSTLMDGNTPFKYHSGSHFLFNSFKNIIGISAYQFYNLIYPAVFIPLFIYSIVVFIENYLFKLKINIHYLYFLILALLAIYFSLDKFSYLGQPIGSESYTISLILSFLALSVMFGMDSNKISVFQLLFFSCCIAIIYFNKISTGLLMASGLSYLFLRKEWSLKSMVVVAILNIVIFSVIYLTIFPNDRVGAQDSLIHRYYSIWKHSQGIFDYLSGVLIFLFYLLKRYDRISIQVIKNYFKIKRYLYLEFLAIVSFLGILGSWAVSNHGNDVIYFGSVQLYLCFPLFAFFLYTILGQLKISIKGKVIVLIFLLLFSVLSKPEGFKSIVDYKKIKSEGIQNYNNTYSQLARRLKGLYSYENKHQTCIYIPKTEEWFFNGLVPDNCLYRDNIESSYIVPALSGMALIGGIPQSVLSSDYPYYGVYFHRLQRPMQVINEIEAKLSAKKFGYKAMIKFALVDNKLTEELIEL